MLGWINKNKKTAALAQKAAHDLRSPLSVLMGYLELKENGGLSAEEETQYLTALKTSAQKIARIADTLASGTCAPATTASPRVNWLAKQDPGVDVALGGRLYLVVDDDDGMRAQWRLLLKRHGFAVVEAVSGEHLLGMHLDFAQLTGAVVDYHYEGSELNGLDVIEYLHRKKIPRIHLCTANHQDAKVRAQAEKLGVAGIIAKPLSPEGVAAMLAKQSGE